MNQEQMSKKCLLDPKWRIKIRFFDIALRLSNIFSILFLHSLGIGKTWKKSFSKNPRWWLKLIFSFQHHGSGSLYRKVILPIFFDRTPFDGNTI
jgi:hypothetical protein